MITKNYSKNSFIRDLILIEEPTRKLKCYGLNKEGKILLEVINTKKDCEEVIELLMSQYRRLRNILIIPNLKNKEYSENILVVSKGFRDLFVEMLAHIPQHVIEVDEVINRKGLVKKPLKENEINKMLREVFRSTKKQLVITLFNSIINPLHEKNMENVLTTAGYRVEISSNIFYQNKG